MGEVGKGLRCGEIQSTRPLGTGFLRRFEGDIRQGGAFSAVGWIAGGDLHLAKGPDVIGNFHDVLDLKLLHQSAVFIVASDAHESTELGVDPDVNYLVAARGSLGFIDAELVARLAADILSCFKFWVGPVEETQREVFVGQIGAGDGLDDLCRGKLDGLTGSNFKKIERVIAHPHVENTPRAFVFRKLELDVLPLEKKGDGDVSALFLEISGQALIQLGEGGREPCSFENLLGGRLLGLGSEAGNPRDGEGGGWKNDFKMHRFTREKSLDWTSAAIDSFKKVFCAALDFEATTF
jgi:hypothetical protein